MTTAACIKQAGAQVQFARVDSLINNAINEKLFPGGALAIIRDTTVVYSKIYGNKAVYPEIEPLTRETMFDLASVTKPFTGISIMLLVEQGKLRLEDAASRYLPFLPDNISVTDLLTHTSGIPDYSNVHGLIEKGGYQNRKVLEEYIGEQAGKHEPGSHFEYSCLNYISLQYIVEKITGKTLDQFEKEEIFIPLGMYHTGFRPKGELRELCAPTEMQADGSVLKGAVHDSLALYMNDSISGNAGLFSNIDDMIIFAKMLLGNGCLNGTRILSPLTVKTMTAVPRGYEKFGRSLGWDNYSSYSSDHGNLFPKESTYGHTGYTGPSIFIDPVNKVAVIFLAHRVHPYNVGSMVSFRARLANIIGGAIL